jgi:hypothetical protein
MVINRVPGDPGVQRLFEGYDGVHEDSVPQNVVGSIAPWNSAEG